MPPAKPDIPRGRPTAAPGATGRLQPAGPSSARATQEAGAPPEGRGARGSAGGKAGRGRHARRKRPLLHDIARATAASVVALALLALSMQQLDYYVDPAVAFALQAAFLAVAVVALVVVGRARDWAVHWCFLALWIVLGAMNLVLMPPGFAPDFAQHFMRAFCLTNGDFLGTVDLPPDYTSFPYNIYAQDVGFDRCAEMQVLWNNPDVQLDYSRTVGFPINTMLLYAPIAHVPGAVGIAIARLFTSNVWVLMYASRISTWTISGALLFVVIRAMPVAKPVFAFMALQAHSVMIGSSSPADPLTMVALFGLFAYVFWVRQGKRRASVLVLALLVVFVSLMKIVYLPVCLLVLLVPKESFPRRPGKAVVMLLLAVLAVAANLLWLNYASRFLIEFHEGVNSGEQVQHMLSDPVGFLVVLGNSLVRELPRSTVRAFGQNLSMVGPVAPIWMPVAMMALYAFVCLRTRLGADAVPCVRGWERVLLVAIFVIEVLLTFTSLYVQWTPVGESLVVGFQGRYFIPILPFLVVGLFPRENRWLPSLSWVLLACLNVLEFAYPISVAL